MSNPLNYRCVHAMPSANTYTVGASLKQKRHDKNCQNLLLSAPSSHTCWVS